MIYILLATFFYTIAVLLIASANRNVNSNVSVTIVNIVSGLIPLAVIIPSLSKKVFFENKFGVLMALAGGVFIALYALALGRAYATEKVGIAVPLVFGGSILFATIASYFVFKEKISPTQAVGLALLALGLGVIVYARATGK